MNNKIDEQEIKRQLRKRGMSEQEIAAALPRIIEAAKKSIETGKPVNSSHEITIEDDE